MSRSTISTFQERAEGEANNMTINVYRAGAEWCYAAFVSGGYDHSDTVGIEDSASEAEAMAEMAEQFPQAKLRRVEDLQGD